MVKKDFIVGENYVFRYIKKIELDEEFYVFEDFGGERYLLSAYYYQNYNFKAQQEVLCKILRIDCSGKVSIEPEHPYYKSGMVYDFKFKEYSYIKEESTHKYEHNGKTEKKHYVIVIDKYGNEHAVALSKKPKTKNNHSNLVACRVISITKGNFELQIVENTPKKFFKKLFRK